MKILLVSDEESRYYWDFYKPGCLDGIDLIISAGDLKAEYLSFLVTMTNKPVLYVHGNHDKGYEKNPPEGCECIDGKVVKCCGLRIMGLGGSIRYNGKPPFQYSEQQQRMRAKRLALKAAGHGGVDIIVSHAPVKGFGELADDVHKGFEVFRKLIEKYNPAYFVHGHVHMAYTSDRKRVHEYKNTKIINAYGKYILEIDDETLKKSR